VPIVKGCSTEMSIDVASLGVQIHGGMGFIEETGAAQYYRDARILTIYEGTTAIQANDFVGRKTLRDAGAVAKQVAAAIAETERMLSERASSSSAGAAFEGMRKHLVAGREALVSAVDFVVAHAKSDPNAVFAGSVPYLKLAGIVLGGWQMARAMLAADAKRSDDPSFSATKIATASFYASHILSQATGIAASIVETAGDDQWLAQSVEAY
jgi:hypothetical protein